MRRRRVLGSPAPSAASCGACRCGSACSAAASSVRSSRTQPRTRRRRRRRGGVCAPRPRRQPARCTGAARQRAGLQQWPNPGMALPGKLRNPARL
eukprot:2671509-Prymnesium_polylepis.1